MRPRRLVVVVGTGTDVGKTWVAARLLIDLRAAGLHVAARKPAQSFDRDDDPAGRDAAVLGAASGEEPESVCPPHRWYEVPMAPPMAAEVLGRPPFGDRATCWRNCRGPGAVRRRAGRDGRWRALAPRRRWGWCRPVRALAPDLSVLVADAGLGTINAVRLTIEVLDGPCVVVLNRFDPSSDLHARNLVWLRERDGLRVVRVPGGETELLEIVSG